jgi:bifunctional DNA-binding transcriptional regulator/antitoxin component of YhaV-PrlF toxin-antitoxin module
MANTKSSDTFYMNVDSKGRPTIPSDVRKEIGLEEGGTLCGKIIDGKLMMVVPDDPFDKLALNAQKELDEGEGRIAREPGK